MHIIFKEGFRYEAEHKFMPEMHFGQHGFILSACSLFPKNKTRTQKFKATEYSRYINKKELQKVCFQHDILYEDFKYLPRRTLSDKLLYDKTLKITSNSKYDGYQCRLLSMVYKFCCKH